MSVNLVILAVVCGNYTHQSGVVHLKYMEDWEFPIIINYKIETK